MKLSELTINQTPCPVLVKPSSSRLVHISDQSGKDRNGGIHPITRCNRILSHFQDIGQSAVRVTESEDARRFYRLDLCPSCGSLDDFKAARAAYAEFLDKFWKEQAARQAAEQAERDRIRHTEQEEKCARRGILQVALTKAGLETEVNGAGNLIITFGNYRYLIHETGPDYRLVLTATPSPNDIGS